MSARLPRSGLVPTAGMVPAEIGRNRRALAGILLTGGASSRMGRDKALLRIAGEPNARRIARSSSRPPRHPGVRHALQRRRRSPALHRLSEPKHGF